MNVQITHVIVHQGEQVEGIIEEAERIADASEARGHPWQPAFEQACALLGQRFTLAMNPEPAPFQLPAMAIPRGRH